MQFTVVPFEKLMVGPEWGGVIIYINSGVSPALGSAFCNKENEHNGTY